MTDEGFLIVPARIARTGIQRYTAKELGITDGDPAKIYNVYRSADQVFSDTSLNSFAKKPVTNDHPPELVTSKNFKKYAVGFCDKDIERDGDYVKTELAIHDQPSVDDVNNGKVELSVGYICDLTKEAGITDTGENYDFQQVNIKCNHIAIVQKGRAGNACRLADSINLDIIDKGELMKIKINGITFDVEQSVAEAIQAEQQKTCRYGR